MLRWMWRELETGLRNTLNGHEEGNLGYSQGYSLRVTAPVLDPTCESLAGRFRRATRTFQQATVVAK
jgi:hypothetical protein